MKKIKENVYHYIDGIKKIEYYSEYVFLYSNCKKYLYFDRNIDNNIYDYFNLIGFSNYLSLISDAGENFSLFLIEHKDENYIESLCDLYLRSFRKVKLDNDIVKNIYDQVNLKIDNLYKYYLKVQDKIEELLHPNDAQYNLIINISNIYHLLDMGKFFLDRWYTSEHTFMLENYIFDDLSHNNFIDGNFIHLKGDFDKSVYFLDKLYKCNYLSNSLFNDIDFIISNRKFLDNNIFLYYSLISIAREIDYNDLIEVNSLNYYVKLTYDFLLKKYEENKESN